MNLEGNPSIGSDAARRREILYQARDRIAYAFFIHKGLGKKLLLAFALGFSLFLLSRSIHYRYEAREVGAYIGWRTSAAFQPYLVGFVFSLATMIVGAVRPWLGVTAFLMSFIVLLALYAPEIFVVGCALALISYFVWFNVRPESGALVALFLIPAFESYAGLAALAPLGFACYYTIGKALVLTAICFVWIEAIGLWTGDLARFGIDGAAMLLPPDLVLKVGDLSTPMWSQPIAAANLRVVDHVGFLFLEGALLESFLLKLALGFGVVWLVRSSHHPMRFQDRLALDYLSKKGHAGGRGDLLLWKLPQSILLGASVWIGVQILGVLLFGLYNVRLLVGDLLACAVIIPTILLDYHGDPTMPHEFSHLGLPPKRGPAKPSRPPSSAFRIPTPSEMRLQYPTSPSSRSGKKDPTQLRLKTWKDRVDLDWEGTLPDGTKIRLEREGESQAVPPPLDKPSTTAFAIGSKIDGQYRIEKIHLGGMGVVYEVVDEFSEVRYAVKTLRDDLSNNPEAVARFTTEAKTWIRLGSQGSHPNMVQALHYREIGGRPLLFLEFVEGTHLEEVFSRTDSRPTIRQMVEWGIQICEGMHFATTRKLGEGVVGVVHRDLKPANLLITKEGLVKITDFGLAKVADAPTNLTREKVGLGTLKYMAPEQVKDAKHVDHRADIYSFGAVMYEGLVGHPPFPIEDSIELYMAVLSKEPRRLRELRSDIPEPLDRIVMRCLDKDREKRYSSFEEAAWALRKVADQLNEGGQGASHLRVVS